MPRLVTISEQNREWQAGNVRLKCNREASNMHIVLRRTDIALSINCTLIARKRGECFPKQKQTQENKENKIDKKHKRTGKKTDRTPVTGETSEIREA